MLLKSIFAVQNTNYVDTTLHTCNQTLLMCDIEPIQLQYRDCLGSTTEFSSSLDITEFYASAIEIQVKYIVY